MGMRQGRRRNRFVIILLLVVVCCMYTVPAARAEEGRVVRVGYYNMQGFQMWDEMGNPYGYSVDYLNLIAGQTRWKYEYVNVGSFIQGLKQLEERKIDLLSPCQITAERMELFDYSTYAFGTEYTALVTTADNEKYSYEDYKSFENMTVAVMNGYNMTDHMIAYSHENGFPINLKYYETPDDALSALKNGEVDAAAANLMMVDRTHKVLARFSPCLFYYMTWKGNSGLLDELNAAMKSIKNTYPTAENQLSEKYFPVYNEQYFSVDEEAYISSLRQITVGYVPDRSPVSFTNRETGELDGITRDIFDRIQEVSGLKFRYVELPSGPVTYQYLKEHQIDMVSGAEYNSLNQQLKELRMSMPYLSTRKVIVSRKSLTFDREAAHKIAMVTGSQTIKHVIKAEYPKFIIEDYDSIRDCFEAVRRGEADILIQNQYVVQDWLDRPQYRQLSVVPVEGLEDQLCFSLMNYGESAGATPLDGDKLTSIINKAITRITKDELDTIIVKETMENKYRYTFDDFCYLYRYTLSMAVLAAAFAMLSIVYILNLKKRAFLIQQEKENKLLLQQKRYELIMEKTEEIIYEINLQSGECISSEKLPSKFGWSFPERIDSPDVDKLMEIWHVHPDDRDKLQSSLKNMIEDNQCTESIIRMQKTDGTYLWCKVARFPLLDNDNILISIVGKIVDVDHDIKEKKVLEIQSRTDGLTRLLNKKTFLEQVSGYLLQNTSKDTALIFIDLDHFKSLNDTLGHMMGDAAIQDAARKLRTIFSDADMVSRFGGDEFCVFVTGASLQMLNRRLTQIVEMCRQDYEGESARITVTASVGAVYCGVGRMKVKDMMTAADQALYEAKEKGRNQFILHTEESE